MYLIEVIPLSRKLPQETLSYLSRKPFARGDVVCAPLQTQTIDVLVVQSSDIRERKQELKSLSSRLRFLCEDTKKENPFSPAYLKAVFSYTDLTGIPTGDIIRVSSPKKMWKVREETIETSHPSSSSPSLLQAPYRERVDTLAKYAKKKQSEHISVHIIIPEREQRVLFTSHLQERLGKDTVFLLDGKMSEAKREKILEHIRRNPSVLITSIPFLDVPLVHKGALVIEQFHSDMYLATRLPFLNLRKLIITYAREAGIELILSDVVFDWRVKRSVGDTELPPLRKIPLFSNTSLTFIPYREERTEKLSDEERIEEILRKMREDSFLFNQRFEEQLTTSVEKGERVFLFAQKKHFSSQLVCLDCGNVIGGSSHRLVREGEKIRFLNRETGEREDAPDFCPVCSSWKLKPLGVGSERLKEALEKRFPKREVILIDAEHGSPRVWRKQVSQLAEKENYILIGTKQVLPYLSLLNVDTLFIPSLDIHFFLHHPEQEERYLYDLATLAQHAKKTVLQTRLFYRKHRENEGTERTDTPFQRILSERIEKLLQERERRIAERFSAEKRKTEVFTQSLPLWNLLSGVIFQREYLSLLEKVRGQYPLPIAILSFRETISQQALSAYQGEIFSLLSVRGKKVVIFVRRKEGWESAFPSLVASLIRQYSLLQLSFL